MPPLGSCERYYIFAFTVYTLPNSWHMYTDYDRYVLPHSAHRHSFVLLPWVCTMLLHQVMEELALAILRCKQDAVEGSALQVWGTRVKKATQFYL